MLAGSVWPELTVTANKCDPSAQQRGDVGLVKPVGVFIYESETMMKGGIVAGVWAPKVATAQLWDPGNWRREERQGQRKRKKHSRRKNKTKAATA